MMWGNGFKYNKQRVYMQKCTYALFLCIFCAFEEICLLKIGSLCDRI